METLKQYAARFYAEHKKELELNYPGISLRRIYQELDDLRVTKEKFFDAMIRGVPLEYISGRAYFYKSEFFVNEHVLIPRSETEILVEIATTTMKKHAYTSLIDVGVGSGNIVLSVLQELNYPVFAYATDIDCEAIHVAKKNWNLLNKNIHKGSTLEFLQMDRLRDFTAEFDLIVSNPPYIKQSEAKTMVHHQVNSYEPGIALYIGDGEYLKWFSDFFGMVFTCLKKHGTFMMEGHENEMENMKLLAEQTGLVQVEIIKDFSGKDRFIIAQKPA